TKLIILLKSVIVEGAEQMYGQHVMFGLACVVYHGIYEQYSEFSTCFPQIVIDNASNSRDAATNSSL
ncbi:hypothetical protein PENTCL1PPCAC_526, partial [Pristionchus entomophagus]